METLKKELAAFLDKARKDQTYFKDQYDSYRKITKSAADMLRNMEKLTEIRNNYKGEQQ